MNYTEIDGGLRVGETDTHYIDVLKMMFNFRVVNTRKDQPGLYDSGFCYFGTDVQSLLRAVAAGVAWAESGAEEPPGWDRNVTTKEVRGTYPGPDVRPERAP
jgi:hypothetical protein